MKINYPILRKALGFAFLPTLLVVIVAMFATLSFTTVFEFLFSDSDGAIALRISLLIVEVILVAVVYNSYLNEEKTKKLVDDSIEDPQNWERYDGGRILGYIGTWTNSRYDTYQTKRINENLYLVKRIQNS